MDYFMAMGDYCKKYDAATEAVGAGTAIVATAGAIAIMKLADIAITKATSKAKEKYNAMPSTQKRKARQEEARKIREKAKVLAKEEAGKAKLAKSFIDGVPYLEWMEKASARQNEIGPTILKLHEEFCKATEADLKKMRDSSSQFKDFPILFYPNRSEYKELYLDIDPRYPNLLFSTIAVGMAVPSGATDFFNINEEDGNIDSLVLNDTDKKALINKSHQLIEKYLVASDKIISKHLNTMIAKLKQAGIPAKDWDYEHMSDEFVVEMIEIECEPYKITK